MGGMMSSFIEPIRIGLQESVRRVTVRVIWDEAARAEQILEVVQYLTDPAKLQPSAPPGPRPARRRRAADHAGRPPGSRARPTPLPGSSGANEAARRVGPTRASPCSR